MNRYFGYIRVSTAKQGEGVSLAEQREAIERFAAKDGLRIVRWFEELETAAKRGRPAFSSMLTGLATGEANGVIIHKIDRSARNLRDWADLGELIDRGIAVHFAAEGLDLGSRGGRLSADIQAVVAADYIRNLREETRKGFYGRLKQGIWPLAAPLGYVDEGGGKVKTIDPVKGPLVRQAFELYASGRYSQATLAEEMHRRGLRNLRGGRVTRTGWSTILNNPFYIGILRIKKTEETFNGAHEPLVSTAVFRKVKDLLHGKSHSKAWKHDYLFRRRVNCAGCDARLIAERQKGHVYYRCHDRACPVRCVREEVIEESIRGILQSLRFSSDEMRYLSDGLDHLTKRWSRHAEEARAKARLEIGRTQARLEKLTDAFLDGTVERKIYENRKGKLLEDMKRKEEMAADITAQSKSHLQTIREDLEQADMAQRSYDAGDITEKRQILEVITSNLSADKENGYVELSNPFDLIAERHSVSCSPQAFTLPRSLQYMPNPAESEDDSSKLKLWKLLFDLLKHQSNHPGLS